MHRIVPDNIMYTILVIARRVFRLVVCYDHAIISINPDRNMKIAIVLLPVKNVFIFSFCCDVLVFGKGKFVKNIYKLGSNKFSFSSFLRRCKKTEFILYHVTESINIYSIVTKMIIICLQRFGI